MADVDLTKLMTEEGVEIAPGVRVRLRSLADYRQNPENPVSHTPHNLSTIVESIHKVGAARSGLAADDTIYAGNLTSEAMALAGIEGIVEVTTDGTKWVMVNRPDLTPEQRTQAAHGDQWSAMLAEMNVDQLLADIEAGVNLDGIYSEFDLEAILGEAAFEPEDEAGLAEKEARQTLAERFIVPPFSVLDARQGYWQERKRAWIALGIESELGRGELLTWVGEGRDIADMDETSRKILAACRKASPGGSLRDAASLGPNGKTIRGDGKGRPIAERERVAPKMAMHNDPMQRKRKYHREATGASSGKT